MQGSMVAGHGTRDGRLQTQAERHTGSLSARDQPNVRVMKEFVEYERQKPNLLTKKKHFRVKNNNMDNEKNGSPTHTHTHRYTLSRIFFSMYNLIRHPFMHSLI